MEKQHDIQPEEPVEPPQKESLPDNQLQDLNQQQNGGDHVLSSSDLVLDQASKRRKANTDLPDPFSRRERETTSKSYTPSSVYAGETEAPAWMNNNQLAGKYGQYGNKSVPKIAKSKNDDRYSKYGATNVDRSKKPEDKYSKYGVASGGGGQANSIHDKYATKHSSGRTMAPTQDSTYKGEEDRGNDNLDELHDEVAPYANLEIANPSKIHTPGESQHQYQTFKSRINNKDVRDINSIVRQHYNQRTKVSKYQGPRSNSPIYKLRNFNNIIKYILLGNNVKRASPELPLSFLDLCCGKGGDLNKCEFIQVDQYIGIDISDVSVKEAFSRYSQQKARFKPHGKVVRDSRRYNFEACFATGDCFTNSIPEILEPNFPGIIENLFPVDCVSVQFSFHYSFETEEKVRTLLTNISRSLRPGGKFIGTMPSSDFIRDKIVRKDYMVNDSNEKVKFGNAIYSVTFDNKPPIDGVFRPPFGNGYTYYLQDAVDNVPEYVVPFETLRALCEEYGLMLKYKKNFIDIYNQEIPKYFSRLSKNIIDGIKRSDGKYGVEGDEKEAVAFYLGFVFEKLN